MNRRQKYNKDDVRAEDTWNAYTGEVQDRSVFRDHQNYNYR